MSQSLDEELAALVLHHRALQLAKVICASEHHAKVYAWAGGCPGQCILTAKRVLEHLDKETQ